MIITLTKLDADLLRLDQTLSELIKMGLVEATFYAEEEGIGPTTRYRLTGRPGQDDEQDGEEAAPVRTLADEAVEAASDLQIVA